MIVKSNATILYELKRIFLGTLLLSMIIFAIICLSTLYSEPKLALGSYENLLVFTSVSESDFLTYDDLITGFSIKYPPDWERAQHIDKSITFITPREGNSDTRPAGLRIMFKEVASNLSLPYITKTQLNTLKNLYPDISILESFDTTFAGHPAHKIVFTATDNTLHLRKAMQVWFKDGTKAYLITYKADLDKYPQYLSTIEKMLNSFYTSK